MMIAMFWRSGKPRNESVPAVGIADKTIEPRKAWAHNTEHTAGRMRQRPALGYGCATRRGLQWCGGLMVEWAGRVKPGVAERGRTGPRQATIARWSPSLLLAFGNLKRERCEERP
jgi:hypothetical protein